MEAVDVENNRTVWQDTLSVAALDMIGMREQITAKVRQGLVPALGAATNSGENGTHPKNEEAYDLYLRSVSVPHDRGPNKDAIAELERSVGMDPSYAPGWEALGVRYYYDATYSNGGEEMFQRSNTAFERALVLDPDLMGAAGSLIINRASRGEVGKAYQDAKALVKRRPESAQAHFALSYVLRYAGMLEEAARECDNALALDPGNYTFRSCTWPFQQLDKPQRAMDFIRLDAGSEWANYALPSLFLRQGKVPEAREAVKKMASTPIFNRDLLQGCLLGPSSELDRIAHADETGMPADVPMTRPRSNALEAQQSDLRSRTNAGSGLPSIGSQKQPRSAEGKSRGENRMWCSCRGSRCLQASALAGDEFGQAPRTTIREAAKSPQKPSAAFPIHP